MQRAVPGALAREKSRPDRNGKLRRDAPSYDATDARAIMLRRSLASLAVAAGRANAARAGCVANMRTMPTGFASSGETPTGADRGLAHRQLAAAAAFRGAPSETSSIAATRDSTASASEIIASSALFDADVGRLTRIAADLKSTAHCDWFPFTSCVVPILAFSATEK